MQKFEYTDVEVGVYNIIIHWVYSCITDAELSMYNRNMTLWYSYVYWVCITKQYTAYTAICITQAQVSITEYSVYTVVCITRIYILCLGMYYSAHTSCVY